MDDTKKPGRRWPRVIPEAVGIVGALGGVGALSQMPRPAPVAVVETDKIALDIIRKIEAMLSMDTPPSDPAQKETMEAIKTAYGEASVYVRDQVDGWRIAKEHILKTSRPDNPSDQLREGREWARLVRISEALKLVPRRSGLDDRFTKPDPSRNEPPGRAL